MRRRYSDEERADALVTLDACGGNASEASRISGVPRKTLEEWDAGRIPPGVAELRQVKKESLAESMDALAYTCVGMLPEKLKAAPAIDIAKTMGIAVDKALVLRGEANNISKTLNDSDPTDARRELLELLFPRGVGSGAGAATIGAATPSARPN